MIHTVQSGDTLFAIAAANNESLPVLEAGNGQIKDPDLIFPGQNVNVSPGAVTTSALSHVYVVRDGDTLSGIAQANDEGLPALESANPQFGNPDLILTGQSVNVTPGTGGGFVVTDSSKPAAQAPASAAPSSTGGFPAGSASQNLLSIGKFLHLHGYSAAAAAGVASCIAGESGGNPESVGSGGGGLIGWTPLSSMYQYGGTLGGDPTSDLNNQMMAIINYNNANGPVSELNSISDPVAAAQFYSQRFERPAVTNSDVVAGVAQSVFAVLGG